jgi:drug/metabolite transporter (DMT)-like permease
VLGPIIAVFSALSFSLSDVAVRRGVARAPIAHGAFITVLIGVPLFLIAAIVTGQILRFGDLSFEAYVYLSAAGLVHYVLGRYFNYAAISAIGAARAGPVQAFTLPYSVLVALLFLDEGVTTGMAIGMGMIMVGPFIMVETGQRRQSVPVSVPPPGTAPPQMPSQAEDFQLKQAQGYFYATIAAISYGSSPVFIRAALEDAGGVSILGGLVSYIAAAAVLIASLILPSRRGLIAAMQPSTVKVFFAAGYFVWQAQMLRFVALSMASVAVVTTLLRFTGIFTLVLSWFLNRELEHITWRVVAGILLSLAGAILLVLTRA